MIKKIISGGGIMGTSMFLYFSTVSAQTDVLSRFVERLAAGWLILSLLAISMGSSQVFDTFYWTNPRIRSEAGSWTRKAEPDRFLTKNGCDWVEAKRRNNQYSTRESIARFVLGNFPDRNRIERFSCVRFTWWSHGAAHPAHTSSPRLRRHRSILAFLGITVSYHIHF